MPNHASSSAAASPSTSTTTWLPSSNASLPSSTSASRKARGYRLAKPDIVGARGSDIVQSAGLDIVPFMPWPAISPSPGNDSKH